MRPYTLLSTFTSIIVLVQVHILLVYCTWINIISLADTSILHIRPKRYLGYYGDRGKKKFYMLLNTFVVNNLLVELLISL